MELVNIFISHNLLSFFGSLVIGIFSTWAARTLAWKIDFLDKPKANVPQHTRAIAYLGGLGIFVGLVISNIVFKVQMPIMFLVFAGIFMVLGLVDDKFQLRAMHKFLIQVVVAIAAAKFCASYDFIGIEVVDLLLSAFWYLVLLNAFNLTDVCDGLLGGISSIVFLFAVMAFPDSAAMWFVVSGSIIGFLLFNSPPASIFMGDAGSHLLGFFAAYMTLSESPVINSDFSFYILACLCAVPISEITFLVIVRYKKGLAWWLSSRDHFALRLQRHGFSKWKTDFIAYLLSVIAGVPLMISIYYSDLSMRTMILSIAGLTVVFLLFWLYLFRIEKLDDLRDSENN